MHDCELPPVLHGTLFVVATVAFVGNVAHLLSVKPPKRGANASDVLQWAKTGVALTALLTVVPLQIMAFSYGEGQYRIVVTTSLLNHLLVDFYPLGLFALALTRLRVCQCRGNAEILITKMSALLTLGLCFLPLSISVILKALITASYSSSSSHSSLVHYCLNSTWGPHQTLQSYYSLFTIILFDILPVILTFILYGLIQKRYRDSEMNSHGRQTVVGWQRRMTIVQHTGRNGRSIGLSVRLLASNIILAWMPYVTLKLIFWFDFFFVDRKIHHVTTLFAIIALYFLSPIAEGVFLRHKRENLSKLFRQISVSIPSRVQVDILTTQSMGSINNGAASNDRSTCVQTPVFFTGSSNEISTWQEMDGPDLSTQGIVNKGTECCHHSQTACGSDDQPGQKKRRVCFSSDLEQDCEWTKSPRRMSMRSMTSRRQKHSSTTRSPHNHRFSRSSRFSECINERSSHQSDCSVLQMMDSHDCSLPRNTQSDAQMTERVDSERHIHKRRKMSLANLNLYPRRDNGSVAESEESFCYCNSQISWIRQIPVNTHSHRPSIGRHQRPSSSNLSPIGCFSPNTTSFSVPTALRRKDNFAFSPADASMSSDVFTPGLPPTNNRPRSNSPDTTPPPQMLSGEGDDRKKVDDRITRT